ncbi:MAG: hypothetical protein MI924_13365 [Chloroflexales bacterium]|nr:hypothetical protein [Chloroflexales bacterium]
MLKHIGIIALLGALFGVSEWFYSLRAVVYALIALPYNPVYVYITWIVLPAVIVVYESVRTRRVLFAYLAANVFLIMAVQLYYASYVFDLLFLNTNELLRDLHYETINWPSFIRFVRTDIGSKAAEWTLASLALGFALGFLALIIVALLKYIDRIRTAQR